MNRDGRGRELQRRSGSRGGVGAHATRLLRRVGRRKLLKQAAQLSNRRVDSVGGGWIRLAYRLAREIIRVGFDTERDRRLVNLGLTIRILREAGRLANEQDQQ